MVEVRETSEEGSCYTLGKGTKGLKTRNNKKTDKFIISRKVKENNGKICWKGPFVHPSLLKKLANKVKMAQKDQSKLGREIQQ